VTVGLAGAEGKVAGTTTAEGADAGELPTPLLAFTVNVYVVPFLSVPTTQLNVASDAGEQVFVAGDEVTVYALTGVPFVDADAVHDTPTLLLPRVTMGLPGAVGVPGMTAVDEGEGSDVPVALWAVTVKEYADPFVSVPNVQLSVESDDGEQVSPPGDIVTV
jgi:hypothetical protein